MSKSKKKQTARKRAAEAAPQPEGAGPAAVQPQGAPPAAAQHDQVLELPKPSAMPLDQALYDRIVAAATKAGQMREEGERMSWVYNGNAVALKYTEADEQQPARILVAAFRQGVVFQVEGDRQVVYQPGPWEQELDQLEPAADDEEDDDLAVEEDGDEP